MSKHSDILISSAETIERKRCSNESFVIISSISDSVNNSSSSNSKNENKGNIYNRQDLYVYEPSVNAENVNETNKEQEKENEISDSQHNEGKHILVAYNNPNDKKNVVGNDATSTIVKMIDDIPKESNLITFKEACENEKKIYNNNNNNNSNVTMINEDETDRCNIDLSLLSSNQLINSKENIVNTTALLNECSREGNEMYESENNTFSKNVQMMQHIEIGKEDNDETKVEREIEEANEIKKESVFENFGAEDVAKMTQEKGKEQEQRENIVLGAEKQIDQFNSDKTYMNILLETVQTNAERESNLKKQKEMETPFLEVCAVVTEKQQTNNSASDEYIQLNERTSEHIESPDPKLIHDRSIQNLKEISSIVNYTEDPLSLINFKNPINETNESLGVLKDTLNTAFTEHITEKRGKEILQNDMNDNSKLTTYENSGSKDKSRVCSSCVSTECHVTCNKANFIMKTSDKPLYQGNDIDNMKNEYISIKKRKRNYSVNDITKQEPICRKRTESVEHIMSMNELQIASDMLNGNSYYCDRKSDNACRNINEHDNNSNAYNNNNIDNDNCNNNNSNNNDINNNSSSNTSNNYNNNNNNNIEISNLNGSYSLSHAASPRGVSEAHINFKLNGHSANGNINHSYNETNEKNICSLGDGHTKNFSNFFILENPETFGKGSFSKNEALSNFNNSFSYDDVHSEKAAFDTTEAKANKQLKLSCSEIEFLNNASAATNDGEKMMQWFDAIYTVCVRLDDLCCRLNSNFPHSMQLWENSNKSTANNLKSLLFNRDSKNKMDTAAENSCNSDLFENSINNEKNVSSLEHALININNCNQNIRENANENEEGNFSNIFMNSSTGTNPNTDTADAKLNDISNKFYKNPYVKESLYDKWNGQDKLFPVTNEMVISPTNLGKNNEDSTMPYSETFNKTDIVQQSNINNKHNCEYMSYENDEQVNGNSINPMGNICNNIDYNHVPESVNVGANNFFCHANNIHPQNMNGMYVKEAGEYFNLKSGVTEYVGVGKQNKTINDCDFPNILHRRTAHIIMNEQGGMPVVNNYNSDPNKNEITNQTVAGNAKLPGRTRVRKKTRTSEVSNSEEKKTPRKKNSVSKKSNKTLKTESEFEYLLALSDKEGPSSENPDDLKCDVAGVYWDKRSWIASWYDNGKRYYKSFSAKTHGFYKSKFCAIKVRLSKVKGQTIFGKNSVSNKRKSGNANNANGNLSNHNSTIDMQMHNNNVSQQHHGKILNNVNYQINNKEVEKQMNV